MFLTLFGARNYVHTSRSIKSLCALFGLQCPARVSDMYLSGESAEFLSAAIYAVNSTGV